jgi:hypothetical protein
MTVANPRARAFLNCWQQTSAKARSLGTIFGANSIGTYSQALTADVGNPQGLAPSEGNNVEVRPLNGDLGGNAGHVFEGLIDSSPSDSWMDDGR